MHGRHILTHVGVVVVGLGLAAAAGVPMATALPIALVASCALMMLTMMGGHGQGHHHSPPRRDDDDPQKTSRPHERPDVHTH